MKNLEKNGIWVYEYDRRYPYKYEITEVRYVLGEIFDTSIPKALICIGINPSTAIPEDLDPTLLRIQRYAKSAISKEDGKELYGAWYMLNVYPQRSTDPNGMHLDERFDQQIHDRNIDEIKAMLGSLQGGADVWCAWGNNITRRGYLKEFLHDILTLFQKNNGIELKSHVITGEGHPAHPLASIANPDKPSDLEKDKAVKGQAKDKLKPLSEWAEKGLNNMYKDFI